jgi:hypothetical protein
MLRHHCEAVLAPVKMLAHTQMSLEAYFLASMKRRSRRSPIIPNHKNKKAALISQSGLF